ncbi:hypothetical protein AOA12_17520 [Microbacterium sp. No. 7]|nr:hypothetical protein AOA12_17520 [Microbacterium sp. No. 7]
MRRVAALTLLLAPAVLAGCAGAVVEVGIRDLRFTPQEVTVRVGDTVRWRFDDEGLYHHVEADDASFDSDIVGEGTYDVTFTEPGTYPYACSVHPYMTGTVVVSE